MSRFRTLLEAGPGETCACLLDGWAVGESGFTWMVGDRSGLLTTLEQPLAADEQLLLELDLNPFTVPDKHESQRLTISINGHPLRPERLHNEGTVAYPVPAAALNANGSLQLDLHHPDAARPGDVGGSTDSRRLAFALHRLRLVAAPRAAAAPVTVLPPLAIPLPRDQLGDAIRAATGLEPAQLAECFVNIGHNCEVGLVQRHVGAEPIDLLRFVGIALPDLVHGLTDGFARAGDALKIWLAPSGGGREEYMVRDTTYNFSRHSFQMEGDIAAGCVHRIEARNLRFMRDHFQGRMADADRVFVFQRPGRITPSQALPILTRLRGFGPNALLYVDQSPDLPCGSVEQLGRGLFHGKLDRFAPSHDAGQLDLAGWLSILANTYKLWTRSRTP